MSDPLPGAAGLDPSPSDLDPRLAHLARVLGRALARRRLRDHQRPKTTLSETTPYAPPPPPHALEPDDTYTDDDD